MAKPKSPKTTKPKVKKEVATTKKSTKKIQVIPNLELVVKKPKKSTPKKIKIYTPETRYKSLSSEDFITVVDQQLNITVFSSKGQANFNFIDLLHKQKDYETLFTLGNVEAFVFKYLSDLIEFSENKYYLLKEDRKFLIPRFSDHLKELCLDIDSFKNLEYFKIFLRRLLQNESEDHLSDFLGYLSSQKFIINENGNIIAYKAIKNDYKDKYSGKIDNSVGTVVSMPRDLVDKKSYNTCSTGLHVGNKTYIRGYCSRQTDIFVAVEIDPIDLVSVPGRSEGKIRVCKYKVLCRVNFDTTLESTKFLDTAEFIKTNGLPDIKPPDSSKPSKAKKLAKGLIKTITDGSHSIDEFVKWLSNKIRKSKTKEITYGSIQKAAKKDFPDVNSSSIKLYVMKYFTIVQDSKMAKSKVTLRLNSPDYHC